MSKLITYPNIPGQDLFYAELIEAQRDLSDEAATQLLAQLTLILSNHIGNREVLSEAIALARAGQLPST